MRCRGCARLTASQFCGGNMNCTIEDVDHNLHGSAAAVCVSSATTRNWFGRSALRAPFLVLVLCSLGGCETTSTALQGRASLADSPKPAASVARAQSCNLNMPYAGGVEYGTVAGTVPQWQTLQSTARIEQQVGGLISPQYLTSKRILIDFNGSNTIAVLQSGMVVHKGDIVTWTGRHRDPHTPCSFVPVIVQSVVKTASQ